MHRLLANRTCRETLWPGLEYVLRAFGHHQLEVLDEAGRKRIVPVKILLPAWPGVRRIQDLRRHPLALNRHFEAKYRIFLVRHLKQRPAESSVQKRARVLDADALADTKRSAGPSRVDQP